MKLTQRPQAGFRPPPRPAKIESSMFEALIVGHVGSAKLVSTPGKSDVLNLNIAANRKVGDKEYTDWVSAKIWGERAAKVAPHIAKGMRLLLKGRPEARGYTKSDGTPAAELILHVSELEFLSAKPKDDTGEPAAHAEEAAELALDAVA